MLEVFISLLFASAFADVLLQSTLNANWNQARYIGALILRFVIVLTVSVAALGNWHVALPSLALVHLVIDLAKTFAPSGRLWPFFTDQAARLAAIAGVAFYAPNLWTMGFWSEYDWVVSLMALSAGALISTRTGSFAVGLLLTPYADNELPQGLINRGALIGMLERGMIFIFVIVGQTAAIGFLVAAKSISQFSNDQRASEYVIIGTLASFGWAMTVAWATLALLGATAPIGIPALSP